MGGKCNNCVFPNHYAKVCRKKTENQKNTSQNTRVIHTKNLENTEKSNEQIVHCIHYYEQFYSHCDYSEDNHVAMIDNADMNKIAWKK